MPHSYFQLEFFRTMEVGWTSEKIKALVSKETSGSEMWSLMFNGLIRIKLSPSEDFEHQLFISANEHSKLSVVCRPTGSLCLWQNLSADCWPTVGRQSANRRPTVGRQTNDRFCHKHRLPVGRQTTDSLECSCLELFFTITQTLALQSSNVGNLTLINWFHTRFSCCKGKYHLWQWLMLSPL